MFTYIPEDGVLFSSDAFGQHYASTKLWSDEIGEDAVIPHAKKYFANILLPFAPKVLKLIEDVSAMNLDIKMICPDHGMMWRENPGRIIDLYREWSEQKPASKAVVIYDTMWNSTEKMAYALVAALADHGIEVKPMHARKCHRSDIATEILDAKAILVGSPTLNNGMFPTISDVLTYLKGLKPQNKVAAAFGSFGWSGESVKIVNKALEEMKFEVIDPGIKVKYVPKEDALEKCAELGRKTAERILGSEW
jgi:flavorubredoxin